MPSYQGRDARITRSSEYARIYGTGIKVPGKYLILFAARAGESGARVGITVSGKVGKAVERNRAKRRIREALKLELNEPTAPRSEMVFVARAAIKTATFEDIRKDIKKLIGKVPLSFAKESGQRNN
jgi:ribonuclease P protein component